METYKEYKRYVCGKVEWIGPDIEHSAITHDITKHDITNEEFLEAIQYNHIKKSFIKEIIQGQNLPSFKGFVMCTNYLDYNDTVYGPPQSYNYWHNKIMNVVCSEHSPEAMLACINCHQIIPYHEYFN